jgi:hypothetical protein
MVLWKNIFISLWVLLGDVLLDIISGKFLKGRYWLLLFQLNANKLWNMYIIEEHFCRTLDGHNAGHFRCLYRLYFDNYLQQFIFNGTWNIMTMLRNNKTG